MNTRRETTICNKCSSWVVWSSNDDTDDRFYGIIDKLRHHQEKDNQCIRESKLRELLGDDEVKTSKLNLTFLD